MSLALRRIALTVEYDGTNLCGWQRQDNGPTVQGHIETVLSQILNGPIRVWGASRTDSGVHARGQVCHFDTTRPISVEGIVRGLNSLLPTTIAIANGRETNADFHARFSSRGKDYRYLIWNRPQRAPRLATRVWHIRRPLELGPMMSAANRLVGEHDFSAFRATGCSAKTANRAIYGIAIGGRSGGLIAIDVRGNAFLRNMVRIVVGTLADVGTGRLTTENISAILESKDRTQAGQTAPAAGLSLIRVHYTEPKRTAPPTITNHDEQLDRLM